jgi:actin-related protein 2
MLLESHPSKGKDGRDKEAEGSQSSEMWLCGEQTEDKRSLLELTFPLARGVIQDWPAMDRLWQYTFGDKLGLADLRGYSVLLTEAPLNPVDNRRRMLQAMFERFGCDRVHVATQAVLTLYSQGLTTGLVVDSGDGVTHVVPVWDGFVLDHLTRRLDLAGRKVTEQLRNLLVTRRGLCLGKQPADLELMRALKERVCYVSPSYADDVRVEDETTFHLTEQLLSVSRPSPIYIISFIVIDG